MSDYIPRAELHKHAFSKRFDAAGKRINRKWRIYALLLFLVCWIPVAWMLTGVNSEAAISEKLTLMVWSIFFVGTYLAPSLIAICVRSAHTGPIFFSNIFLGWLVLPWVIGFVYAFFRRGEIGN